MIYDDVGRKGERVGRFGAEQDTVCTVLVLELSKTTKQVVNGKRERCKPSRKEADSWSVGHACMLTVAPGKLAATPTDCTNWPGKPNGRIS
jgi:hypothetical protein